MFFQNTPIHYHENPCFASLLRRALVDHVFLHPNCGHFQGNCCINDFVHVFRTAKYVNDVDLRGNVRNEA